MSNFDICDRALSSEKLSSRADRSKSLSLSLSLSLSSPLLSITLLNTQPRHFFFDPCYNTNEVALDAGPDPTPPHPTPPHEKRRDLIDHSPKMISLKGTACRTSSPPPPGKETGSRYLTLQELHAKLKREYPGLFEHLSGAPLAKRSHEEGNGDERKTKHSKSGAGKEEEGEEDDDTDSPEERRRLSELGSRFEGKAMTPEAARMIIKNLHPIQRHKLSMVSERARLLTTAYYEEIATVDELLHDLTWHIESDGIVLKETKEMPGAAKAFEEGQTLLPATQRTVAVVLSTIEGILARARRAKGDTVFGGRASLRGADAEDWMNFLRDFASSSVAILGPRMPRGVRRFLERSPILDDLWLEHTVAHIGYGVGWFSWILQIQFPGARPLSSVDRAEKMLAEFNAEVLMPLYLHIFDLSALQTWYLTPVSGPLASDPNQLLIRARQTQLNTDVFATLGAPPALTLLLESDARRAFDGAEKEPLRLLVQKLLNPMFLEWQRYRAVHLTVKCLETLARHFRISPDGGKNFPSKSLLVTGFHQHWESDAAYQRSFYESYFQVQGTASKWSQHRREIGRALQGLEQQKEASHGTAPAGIPAPFSFPWLVQHELWFVLGHLFQKFFAELEAVPASQRVFGDLRDEHIPAAFFMPRSAEPSEIVREYVRYREHRASIWHDLDWQFDLHPISVLHALRRASLSDLRQTSQLGGPMFQQITRLLLEDRKFKLLQWTAFKTAVQ